MKSAALKFVRSMTRAVCSMIPDKLAVMVHEATDIVRKMDYPGAAIFLHADSDVELRARLHSVAKEPEMLPWLRDALRPGYVMYDIGANVGAYSLLAAAVHGGAVDVIAFEPGATNYAQLCRNLALNPWGSRITALPIALVETCGLVRFGYSDLTAGAALHSVGQVAATSNEVFAQQVLGMALDDLVRQYRLPLPNAVKIDVDGGELGVLRGGEATFRSSGMRSMLIELEDGAPETAEIIRLLASWGLSGSRLGVWEAGKFKGREARFANHVFSRAAR